MALGCLYSEHWDQNALIDEKRAKIKCTLLSKEQKNLNLKWLWDRPMATINSNILCPLSVRVKNSGGGGKNREGEVCNSLILTRVAGVFWVQYYFFFI